MITNDHARREERMPSKRIVKDLIRPLDQYFHVKEDDTVRDALRLLDKAKREKRPLCLLVVGSGGPEREMIKGFVTPRDVVFGLTARFLRGAEKSGPIFWEGQLDAECLDGFSKKVAEIMRPVAAYARESERLMEAVFLLHRHKEDFLPVASDDNVVGTIHINDILTEIIRRASERQEAAAGAVIADEP
jgi:CBS domain-containing protein